MTATVANLNISSELTPSRKRKRQFDRQQEQEAKTAATCFTNSAFSSTPNRKILAKRRINNKENVQGFAANIGLEVKSIADLVNGDTQEIADQKPVNPFEVLRKPPKKKKRQAEEKACFENPALNLDLPEKQFNPYEIVREKAASTNSNCFVNPALNLKTEDIPASRNPFEIKRDIPKETAAAPCNLTIGLPFAPTVGCRIDFKDMSVSQLTPSKLLAEKLVFSPIVAKSNKVSLGSIGEETMDIGKELDRYQLELENSINEAKLRRTINDEQYVAISPIANSIEIDVRKNIKMTQKLTEIKEDGEMLETIEETIQTTQQHTEFQINYNAVTEIVEQSPAPVRCTLNPFEHDEIQMTNSHEAILNTNPFVDDPEEEIAEDLDDLYGCAENDVEIAADDSFDFKAPAAFVRAYTRPASPKLKVSKESLECKEDNEKASTADDPTKKSMNVKNLIRKSIRKLMHPHQHKPEDVIVSEQEKTDNEKHVHAGFINSIRQSLRRSKPARTLLQEEPCDVNECELSIIDGSERTMKLKSNLAQTEYAKIEDLTNERKHNIRNSIRRSTREVGHQFMKTVFHKKHEEYEFGR